MYGGRLGSGNGIKWSPPDSPACMIINEGYMPLLSRETHALFQCILFFV